MTNTTVKYLWFKIYEPFESEHLDTDLPSYRNLARTVELTANVETCED